jgi:hypothetical protein
MVGFAKDFLASRDIDNDASDSYKLLTTFLEEAVKQAGNPLRVHLPTQVLIFFMYFIKKMFNTFPSIELFDTCTHDVSVRIPLYPAALFLMSTALLLNASSGTSVTRQAKYALHANSSVSWQLILGGRVAADSCVTGA